MSRTSTKENNIPGFEVRISRFPLLFQAFLNKKKKASIHYLYLSIATSIKLTAAHHQQESSQLFLIGNEKEANYNFVDREKTNTTENMKETVYHSTFIASRTKLNAT